MNATIKDLTKGDKLKQIFMRASDRVNALELDPEIKERLLNYWFAQMNTFYDLKNTLVKEKESQSTLLSTFKDLSDDARTAEKYIEWSHTVMKHVEEEGLQWTRTIKEIKNVYEEMMKGKSDPHGKKELDGIADLFDIPDNIDDLIIASPFPIAYEGEDYGGLTQATGGSVKPVDITIPGQGVRHVVLKINKDKRKAEAERKLILSYAELGHAVVAPIHASDDAVTITTPQKGRDYRFLSDEEDAQRNRLTKKIVLGNFGISVGVTQGLEDMVDKDEGERKIYQKIQDVCDYHAEGMGLVEGNFTKERLRTEFFRRVDRWHDLDTMHDERIEGTLELYEKHLLPLINDMQKLVIHGDFHPGNVLTENGNDEHALYFDFQSFKAPHVYDIVEFVSRVGFSGKIWESEEDPEKRSELDQLLFDIYHGFEDKDVHVKGIKELAEEASASYVDYERFREDFAIASIDLNLRNATIHLKTSQEEKYKGAKSRERLSRINDLKKMAHIFYSKAIDILDNYEHEGFSELSEALQDNVMELGIPLDKVDIDYSQRNGFPPTSIMQPSIERWGDRWRRAVQPTIHSAEVVRREKDYVPPGSFMDGEDLDVPHTDILEEEPIIEGIRYSEYFTCEGRGFPPPPSDAFHMILSALNSGRKVEMGEGHVIEIVGGNEENRGPMNVIKIQQEDGQIINIDDRFPPGDEQTKLEYEIVKNPLTGEDAVLIRFNDLDIYGLYCPNPKKGPFLVTDMNDEYITVMKMGSDGKVHIDFPRRMNLSTRPFQSIELNQHLGELVHVKQHQVTNSGEDKARLLYVSGQLYLDAIENPETHEITVRDARHKHILAALSRGVSIARDGNRYVIADGFSETQAAPLYRPLQEIPVIIGLNPAVVLEFDTDFDPKKVKPRVVQEILAHPEKIMRYVIGKETDYRLGGKR